MSRFHSTQAHRAFAAQNEAGGGNEITGLRRRISELNAENAELRTIVLHVARLLGTSFQPDGLEAAVISAALTDTVKRLRAAEAKLAGGA